MVHLLWSDDQLTIAPTSEAIENHLTFYEKKLVKVGYKTKTQRVKRRIFKRCEKRSDVIFTLQGFRQSMCRFLEEEGIPYEVSDLRQGLPCYKPNLMHGFRFSQEELLKDALDKDMSGLIGAPTRYGKTYLMLNTLRAYSGLTTVVTAPGADLIKQLYDDIREELPHRDVALIGAGSRKQYPSEDITVISMDSLHKADHGRTELLLIDEPHAAVTTTRLPQLNKFSKARRLGYGATLKGRFDGRDILIEGLIGPVLAERTYAQAVAEGAICPLRVYFIKVPLDRKLIDQRWTRTTAFKNLLFESDRIANIIKKICHEVIPEEWQTLIFIDQEKQAEFLLTYVGKEGSIAMAKRFKSKTEREEFMTLMKDSSIKRCLASNIYGQGVTFSDSRVMINAAGGGNNTMTIQKPGRLAEAIPGKKRGVIFDFYFEPSPEGTAEKHYGEGVNMLFVDSRNRHKAYKEKGYEIEFVSNFTELIDSFERDCT